MYIRITYVYGSYDSIYGTIESNWQSCDGKITTYTARVPANTTATLYLSISKEQAAGMSTSEGAAFIGMKVHNAQICAVYELTAGTFEFQCS